VQTTSETGGDIWTVPIEVDHDRPRVGTPDPFLRTRFREFTPAFSPDGHWLAYTSNESGIDEVYVRPFPGPGGRTQVSSGGGMFPVWECNGRELFFLSSERLITVADYSVSSGTLTAGKPHVWSRRVMLGRGTWTSLTGFPTSMFDVAPGGKRIAVTTSVADVGEQKPVTHVTLLMNFLDYLRQRVPLGKQ